MKKFFLSLLIVGSMAGNVLHAQSVDQGRKFLYYERFKSAREQFEKTLAANPNNLDAVYWLGQTLIKEKNQAAAKDLYQKTLQSNGAAPLVLVGMGHIELLEGKANDARQRFETAISLTKGKDVTVLNAIGYANANAKDGDGNYAVEKLTQATQVKGFNNADVYINLGDAYRKLVDGGGAVTAYQKALTIDPKLAAAKYKIGKVYLTQNNKDYFLPAFEEAVTMDPAYNPAYYELFYYWYFRDVNKAAPYLDKYIANADQGPEMEYLKTDFLYASGKFAEAKTKAQGLISQLGDKVSPRMYRLIAYTSDTTGDLTGAKQAIQTFFAKATPEEVLPTDYEELASINAKIPGSEAEAFTNYFAAVDKDSIAENKAKYLNKAAALAKKMGDRKQEAVILGKAYSMKKTPTQTDLYNWGLANYQAANYVTADSIFCGLYQSKYPQEIFGYLWCARAKEGQDTTWATGVAVDAYEKLAVKAMEIDSVKYKRQFLDARFKLTIYYNDVKKDKSAALAQLDRILASDPTNENALKIKDMLNKPTKQPATQPKKTAGASSPGGAGSK